MNIYPAIDLRRGKVVRLRQGDFTQETIFGDDPVAQAAQFEREGATWLHMVDLDGAKGGKSVNGDIVRQIKENTNLQIQLGGGIRSLLTMEYWLEQGIDRVVIGTLALENQPIIGEAVKRFGAEKIVIGIDAKDGLVATHGWKQVSEKTALELACEMQERGVSQILYTDIARDGMLVGPDLNGLQQLVEVSGLQVIASGGIGSYADLRHVEEVGVEGVIIGQALYTGVMDVAKILEEVR